MGVMACSRKGCNHILCDTYISEIGYICGECKQEFKEWLTNNNYSPKNKDEATKLLDEFTDTYKESTTSDPNFNIDEFLKQ